MRPANPRFAVPLPRRRKRPVAARGHLSWRSRLRVFARRCRWAVWLAGLAVLGSVATWAWWYGSRHQWLGRLSKTVDAVAWIAADPSYLAEILIAIFIVVVSLLVWLPKRQAARSQGASAENYFDRENEARKTLAQIIGGVFVLAGLYSSVKTFDLQRKSADLQRDNLKLQGDGQITDRFTKAIDQLGAMTTGLNGKPKINLEVRLGGIYALERIAKDSPKDYFTIMNVLTAYVRQNSPVNICADPRQTKLSESEAAQHLPAEPKEKPIVCADTQAILTIIGKREMNNGLLNDVLNLHQSNLIGAQLYRAHLINANLLNVHLEDAHLVYADLRGAELIGAHLDRADLWEADFSNADLSEVKGLTRGQLIGTIGNRYTILPPELERFRPVSWSK